MEGIHHIRAVFGIDTRNTGQVLGLAKSMELGFENNPGLFTVLSPPLPVFSAQIKLLDDAQVLASRRTIGAATARNVQRRLMLDMMESERVCVQHLANLCPGTDQAGAVILASALSIARDSSYRKGILTVLQGPVSGSVILDAYARALVGSRSPRRYFNWQYTGDGETFSGVTSTPRAKTTISGLTPLHTYGFRVSVTLTDGTVGPWSNVIQFLVR